MTRFGWLADSSDEQVRAALDAADATLASLPLVRNRTVLDSERRWWSQSGVLGEEYVVKFAWSRVPAARLYREGLLLERLATGPLGPLLPELVAFIADPVLVVTRIVPGSPLHFTKDPSPTVAVRIGEQLGRFLALLHGDEVLQAARRSPTVPLERPEPPATTDALRQRYPPLVDAERAARVLAWCDWVDEILAPSPPDQPLVHGDFHGHNQLWDPATWTLRCVIDLETCGPADRSFDFRCLPGPGLDSSPGLLLAAARTYEKEAGAPVDLARVLAWHVRTALGDALWRTEAAVELPSGGTASSWVDDVGTRLRIHAHRLPLNTPRPPSAVASTRTRP